MRVARRQLSVEALEAREVPAVTASLDGGVLTVAGDDAPDRIRVARVGDTLRIDGLQDIYPVSDVQRIEILGGGGDDQLILSGAISVPVRMTGGGGTDRFDFPITSPVRLTDRASGERYDINLGGALSSAYLTDTQKALAPGGVVWAVAASSGNLYVDGQPVGTFGGFGLKALFVSFDPVGRALVTVTAPRGAGVHRSRAAFDASAFDWVASDIAKSQVAPNGTFVALQRDGGVMLNGRRVWNNKTDFFVDSRNRIAMMDRTRIFQRSKGAFGGGWDTLGTGVAGTPAPVLAANGSWYLLQSDGKVMVDGRHVWTNKSNFWFDGQNRLSLMDRSGVLHRSAGAYGGGGWVEMGRDMANAHRDPAGRWYVLQRNGTFRIDGAVAHTQVRQYAWDPSGRAVVVTLGGQLLRSGAAGGAGGWNTLATGVSSVSVDSSGGLSVIRTGAPPAAPLPAATAATGWKFTGSATIVANPALYVSAAVGRKTVDWNLSVSGATSPEAALAAGRAAFASYLQQLAAWGLATVDPASVTGSVRFVAPTVSVSGTSVTEGNSGRTTATVTVQLSGLSHVPVTVRYATRNGSALAGSDYDATSGTITFAPGERTKTIRVSVIGDLNLEQNEEFSVALTDPVGAVLGTSVAKVSVNTDELLSFVSVWDGPAVTGQYLIYVANAVNRPARITVRTDWYSHSAGRWSTTATHTVAASGRVYVGVREQRFGLETATCLHYITAFEYL